MILAERNTVVEFAGLGALSGAITTGLLISLPDILNIESGDPLIISPLSIVAGLVFGIIFGTYLRYLRLASAWVAVLYAAASTVSYFVAVNIAIRLHEYIATAALIGAIVGLIGATCLTAAAALLLPFARRVQPCVLMLTAGGFLGVLFAAPARGDGGFLNWLILFVSWQAGYAAAFATALPPAVER